MHVRQWLPASHTYTRCRLQRIRVQARCTDVPHVQPALPVGRRRHCPDDRWPRLPGRRLRRVRPAAVRVTAGPQTQQAEDGLQSELPGAGGGAAQGAADAADVSSRAERKPRRSRGPQSEETRAKISAALKARRLAQPGGAVSEETRAHMAAAKFGRTASAETRAKMSAAHAGRPKSEQTRQRMSAAKLGRTRPLGAPARRVPARRVHT